MENKCIFNLIQCFYFVAENTINLLFFSVATLSAAMSEIGIPRNRVMASKYVRHDEHGMALNETLKSAADPEI